jgi:hypothetical protein
VPPILLRRAGRQKDQEAGQKAGEEPAFFHARPPTLNGINRMETIEAAIIAD